LVLGRDDLDLVAELLAEDPEGRLVERLRRRRHLAEVEEGRDERARLDGEPRHRLELVGEVGDRRTAAQAQDLAVAARERDTAERRRLPHLELGALRALRLARPGLAAAAAERARRAARATAAARAATAGTRPAEAR